MQEVEKCQGKLKVNESQYKQCGVAQHFQSVE